MDVVRFFKSSSYYPMIPIQKKNDSSSTFKFFVTQLYKSSYQEKWISWISSVGYLTVANVPLLIIHFYERSYYNKFLF